MKLHFTSTSAPTGADYIGKHLGISASTQGSFEQAARALACCRGDLRAHGSAEVDVPRASRMRRRIAQALEEKRDQFVGLVADFRNAREKHEEALPVISR